MPHDNKYHIHEGEERANGSEREYEIKSRHLLDEPDRMLLKFAHLLEKHLENSLKMLRTRYTASRDPRTKADLIIEMRAIATVKSNVIDARQEFTADSVRYQKTVLGERLSLSAYPSRKRGRS